MNVASIDLNLLTAFEALLAERNVTRAGGRLGITQPAMSNTLRRLRQLFGDPLFVSGKHEMLLTPRAMELGPKVIAALHVIRQALPKLQFDPRRSSMSFFVGCTDYLEVLLVTKVHRRLQLEAPGMSLNVRRVPTMFIPPQQELESGTLDFAMGPFPMPLAPQSRLHSLTLFRDQWVCLIRKRHPVIKHRLSLKQLVSLKHITVSYPATDGPGMMDRLLADRGLKRTVAVNVAHFLTVPFYAANSDCIAIVPMRLAEIFVKVLPLQIFPLPVSPSPLDISLLWHSRIHSEAAYVWTRNLIAQTALTGVAPS